MLVFLPNWQEEFDAYLHCIRQFVLDLLVYLHVGPGAVFTIGM